MKKKNLNLKLQLNKEIIANLNNDQMNEINGGTKATTGGNSLCVTWCFDGTCPSYCCPVTDTCPTNTCPHTWNC